MSVCFSRSRLCGAARNGADTLHVGGITALSTTDYPGALAAVVFCQGCPWRCSYCHNPHLQEPRGRHAIPWLDVAAFLARRRGLLDAVVFSGGEPTMQSGIADAMHAAKNMGFRIGLHTAGIYPRRLRALLPLTDWIGMDIKAPFDAYDSTSGRLNSGKPAIESMMAILDSGIDHEFRTTVHSRLLPQEALLKLATLLAKLGVRNYALQEFRAEGCTNATAQDFDSYLTASYCRSIAPLFRSFAVRRAR